MIDVRLVIKRLRVWLLPLHCQVAQVNSAFRPSEVDKSSTSPAYLFKGYNDKNQGDSVAFEQTNKNW